jgi:hypothetical protein
MFLSIPPRLLALLMVCAAICVSAFSLAVMGLWALLLPVYSLVIVGALFRPAQTALGLLGCVIIFEGHALDFTSPFSRVIYALPPGWEGAFGLTTSPIEVAAVLIAVSVSVQGIANREPFPSLPLIVLAVPVAMCLGMAYGILKGAPTNLVYTETRGLIVGVAIFVAAARLAPGRLELIGRTVVICTFVLALVMISRYLFYVRPGNVDVPPEFQFAHENSIMLGIGLLLGAGRAANARDMRTALGMSLFCALILVAMIVTGRRAATLVLLVGALSMGALLLPRRPVMVVAVGLPLLLAFGAYLGAYWNKEYGASAQPARAVRSQFDPTSRDESSDRYRQLEKANVTETVRVNRLFGIGFGRPFAQFQPLPDLTSFWPMQSFTPHQSILWLWLKMGWFGISVFLGASVVVLQRALEQMRNAGRDERSWMTAAVLFSATLMFLIYSTVDIAFAGMRQVGPMMVVGAIALTLPRPWERTQ